MKHAQQAHPQIDLHASHSGIPHEREHVLLERARAGLSDHVSTTRKHLVCSARLANAYAYCEDVTRHAHTSKFTKLKNLPGIWWKAMLG